MGYWDGMDDVRVLDPAPVDTLKAYVDGGGGEGVAAARKAGTDVLLGLLHDAGLRGRGGAGFPTWRKWQAAAAALSDLAHSPVVVNAAEGEPGTFKDRALIRTNPYRVLEGALVAAHAIAADEVIVGLKRSFGTEHDRLRRAVDEMREADWLGDLRVTLVAGPEEYLYGEETALLEVIDGRQPFPRITPPYRRGVDADDEVGGRSASDVELAAPGGAAGSPALVNNVETLANVPGIVSHGASWFRQVGTEASPGTVVCTVSGATRRAGVAEVPLGTPLREVLEMVGGGARRDHQLMSVLPGVANALIPDELFGTPVTYEDMAAAGTGLGSAGFIVFDERTDPVAVAAGVAHFLAVESCGQCEPCKRDGLALASLLTQVRDGEATDHELELIQDRLRTVTDGARCYLAQQQQNVVQSVLRLYPELIGEHLRGLSSPPVGIGPLVDIVDGIATVDVHESKQPDWSYDVVDSGTPPAARLADTPVEVAVGR